MKRVFISALIGTSVLAFLSFTGNTNYSSDTCHRDNLCSMDTVPKKDTTKKDSLAVVHFFQEKK